MGAPAIPDIHGKMVAPQFLWPPLAGAVREGKELLKLGAQLNEGSSFSTPILEVITVRNLAAFVGRVRH